MDEEGLDPYVRVGDHICLHCTDTDGYVVCENTCSIQNSLYVFHNQDKERPEYISNPHVVTFMVMKENRYKLNKKLRQMLQDPAKNGESAATAEAMAKAKELAAAESHDNEAEWQRLQGKALKYGDVIQLRHVFTNKYIHVDPTRTSKHDKSKLKTCLLQCDGKEAQFRILPMYKVNSEGEQVRVNDQVIIESIKVPGQFLFVGSPISSSTHAQDGRVLSELTLGAESSEFSTVKRFKTKIQTLSSQRFLWGGAVVQMQHKHMEGFLDAEGEDHTVHLRIKKTNSLVAASFYRPSSCTTYWQVEGEYSVMSGEPLHWGQHVRIRHLISHMYAYVDADRGDIGMQQDGFDPNTVFKIHPLHAQNGFIEDDKLVRFEHVLSGRWLHGENDQPYQRRGYSCTVNPDPLRLLVASERMEYCDAYTVACIPLDKMLDCNYVVGMLPLITHVYSQVSAELRPDDELVMTMVVALCELERFVKVKDEQQRVRKRILRELKILDMLKDILECEKESVSLLPSALCGAIYDLIHAAVADDDTENSLHMAQYLDFFQAHISKRQSDWQHMVKIMTEIVQNKKQVIARIKPDQIQRCIFLLNKYGHPGYIPLLRALCVCNGQSITQNQLLIGHALLEGKQSVYRFSSMNGEVILGKTDQTFMLTDFLSTDKKCSHKSRDREFLYEQIKLFLALCKSRNQPCIDLIVAGSTPYISLDIILLVINSTSIAEDWKAHFLQLAIGLFIDVGYNTSLTDCMASTLNYNAITREGDFAEWMTKQPNFIDSGLNEKVPLLKEWILCFLSRNPGIIASMDKRNLLLKTSLDVVLNLIKFGYMDEKSLNSIKVYMDPLLSGKSDLPTDECTMEQAHEYLLRGRYKHTEENDSVVAIKHECLKIHTLLIDLHTEFLLERYIGIFVALETDVRLDDGKQGFAQFAHFLQSDEPMPTSKFTWFFASSSSQYARLRRLVDDVFKRWSPAPCPGVNAKGPNVKAPITYAVPQSRLLDLARYQYPELSTGALLLLHKIRNMRSTVLDRAQRAQLIESERGQALHQEVQIFMPLLLRLVTTKDFKAAAILERFTTMLQNEGVGNKLGQQVMLNYGLLPCIFSIIEMEDQYVYRGACVDAYKSLLAKALVLLKEMVRDNVAIQTEVFHKLDILLSIQSCHKELADTLIQVFHNNIVVCRQIRNAQIQAIIKLTYGNRLIPKMLKVLQSTVSLHGGHTVIHRNQALVLQQLLVCYPQHSGIFDVAPAERRAILVGEKGAVALEYFMNIVNLIVLCCKDSSSNSHGFSQNIISVQEVLDIINNKTLHCNLKRPFLKFLLYIFIEPQDPSAIEFLNKDRSLWSGYLTYVLNELDVCLTYLMEMEGGTLPKTEDSYWSAVKSGCSDGAVTLMYVVDAMIPFLQGYLKIQQPKKYQSIERDVMGSIADKLQILLPLIYPLINSRVQQAHLKAAWVLVAVHAGRGTEEINNRANSMQSQAFSTPRKSPEASKFYVAQQGSAEHLIERQINRQLQTFVSHCQRMYVIPNTIQANIPGFHKRDVARNKYLSDGACEALPLHQDFLDHVKTFRKNGNQNYADLLCLISHLKMSRRGRGPPNEELEIRCLQILRSVAHNIVVLLPTEQQQRKLALHELHQLQELYANEDLVATVLDMMQSCSQSLFREVLALLNILLYTNTTIQNKVIEYFLSTKEENFFSMIQDYMQEAKEVALERKFLQQQVKRLKQETEGLQGDQQDNQHSNGQIPLAEKPVINLQKATLWKLKSQSRVGIMEKKNHMEHQLPEVYKSVEGVHAAKSAESKEVQLACIQDDGTVHLIMKVISKLCDGQHNKLQNYMREQPDNLQSYNVLRAIVQYLGVVHSSLSQQAILSMTEVFQTLTELCSGNQENRSVILDSKLMDYVNFALRSFGEMTDCSGRDRFSLVQVIAQLLNALMEENGPEQLKVAKDVALALDISSLITVIKHCYQLRQHTLLTKVGHKIQAAIGDNKEFSALDMRALVKDVGTKLYIILARTHAVTGTDVTAAVHGRKAGKVYTVHGPGEGKHLKDAEDWQAIHYFMTRTLCIEVIKDGYLQTIYFPYSSAHCIRPELKEKVKWNVDRSSPSNKIHDFIQWSDILIRDFYFHQKMMSNPLSKFIISWGRFFNCAVIFLSIVINVIMLSSWEASFSVEDIPADAKTMPKEIYDPSPVTTLMPYYDTVKLSLSVAHNILSVFVLVSFWLSHNPSVPSRKHAKMMIMKFFMALCGKKEHGKGGSPNEDEEDYHHSTHLFSFITFYYIVFVAISIMGTLLQGYFFAFHLFHIIQMVDLLQGVIRAVTVNGKSLIWVTILGMIILYVYALLGFAKMRQLFRPDEQLFCRSLAQCTMSVIRYGMLGDIGEVLRNHELNNTFEQFIYLSIYQITFFIFFTTIGLNIIFGIIVDTFSELRDMKWRAAKDMQEYCFICSIPAYKFEHRPGGFYDHVHHDHCMWSYIYYFIYLTNTSHNDFTSLDAYVDGLREKRSHDYFPFERALVLTNQEEEKDHVMEAMENMAKKVEYLVQKTREHDLRLQVKTQDKLQSKWKKQAVFAHQQSLAPRSRSRSISGSADRTRSRSQPPRNRNRTASDEQTERVLLARAKSLE